MNSWFRYRAQSPNATAKNANLPTGDIEVLADSLTVLNPSEVPPFTIEDETDGGDDIRMRYRYLDLRRNPVRRIWSCGTA